MNPPSWAWSAGLAVAVTTIVFLAWRSYREGKPTRHRQTVDEPRDLARIEPTPDPEVVTTETVDGDDFRRVDVVVTPAGGETPIGQATFGPEFPDAATIGGVDIFVFPESWDEDVVMVGRKNRRNGGNGAD